MDANLYAAWRLTLFVDADLLEVGDAGLADGVGLVDDGGGVVHEAALPAAALILQRDGEAVGALPVALLQARQDHADVTALHDLLTVAAVVGEVNDLWSYKYKALKIGRRS